MSSSNVTFQQLLSELDIEPCFHSLIITMCSNKENYLEDIEAQDLQGELDANGNVIPAAVARGLVRKLQRPATIISNDTTFVLGGGRDDTSMARPPVGLTSDTDENAKGTPHPCSVSLRRGAGDYHNILRCSVRGQFMESHGHKVVTAILDNSFSMSGQWPLVVDAITRVFTDGLLQDENVTLILIVYNTDASEVKLPRTAAELSSLLKTKFAPIGLTNFEKAFKMAQQCISEVVDSLFAEHGVPVQAVDATTLLFTDGQDTSVPPLGYTSQAATDKARKAGDEFQNFLASLQCRAHYTCIAAFGEHHNPGQCQYLSDRYYYINRSEVLSDWLSGGLADMLASSGFCSIRVTLPSGLYLVEPLPKSISLEAGGNVEYEVWLSMEEGNAPSNTLPGTDEVIVMVDYGESTLRGLASLSSAAVVDPTSLEERLFLLDWGEMQLRQIALSLAGGRPSQTELSLLRERLAGVKVLSQPVWDVASDPRARLCGRTLLLARLDELETRRNRLSYALGHFEEEENGDTREMGSVGIDAVLRDASQRVPLSAAARKQVRRTEAASGLPPAESLSEYGKELTYDKFSCCDAKQAADQGDALFYRVSDVEWKYGNMLSAIDRGERPISFSVFSLLSSNGTKVVEDEDGQVFSHVGIPLFASPGHFARAKLVIRDVLARISPDGTYTQGSSELMLVDLLGQYLAAQLRERKPLPSSGAAERSHGLLQRVRSVAALLASTQMDTSRRTALEDVIDEASFFLNHPEKRLTVKNLYRTLALGLLAADYWPAQRFIDLGKAVLDESIQRAMSRSTAGLSGSDLMNLAYSLMGLPDDGGEWLDYSIKEHGIQKLFLKSFRFQTAASDLKKLEEQYPRQYSPRNASLVSQALGSPSPDGTPPIGEWKALQSLVLRWGAILEQAQGSSFGGVWKILDVLMTKESAPCSATLKMMGELLAPEHGGTTLREALPNDPLQVLSSLVSRCIDALPSFSGSGGGEVGICQQPARLVLASKISSLIEQRAYYARIHPIQGAAYPTKHSVSAEEMQLWWGSAAQPVDKQLYREVRRSIHRTYPNATIVVKEALTDKSYCKQGGNFEFASSLDTFIPGLHRRTRDLHDACVRKHKPTQGANAREEAVKEMLLRLRWDHRDDHACAKLSKIVAQIWDGLEGITPPRPLPSAIWIDDEAEKKDAKQNGPSLPDFITVPASLGDARRDNESVTTAGADWSVV